MIDLKKKIAVGLAGGALLVSSLAPAAFANTDIRISGNGSRSDNRISVESDSRTSVRQSNDADIRNSVNISANTGGNRASSNTGGDVSIRTGDADARVRISNKANMNFVNIDCCNSNGGNWNGGNGDMQNGKKLHAFLTGAKEVPGPGDPNGFGHARVHLYPQDGKACVRLHVFNIEPATAAHIHEGDANEAGPVVITLPTPNAQGVAQGCVSADSNLLREIKDDPSEYYVNVHNTPYPNGAVRGQL